MVFNYNASENQSRTLSTHVALAVCPLQRLQTRFAKLIKTIRHRHVQGVFKLKF